MSEEIASQKDTIEKLKSTDTAIVLYENKFREMKVKDKEKSVVIKEQKIALKQIEQTVKDQYEVNAKKDSEIIKVNQEKEELVRQLAEAQKMLAQTSGH